MRLIYFFSIIILFSGCVQGSIYTHITIPYYPNFNKTPIGSKSVSIKQSELIKYDSLYVEWTTNDLLDYIAKKNGLSKFYYADLESWTVLGYYQRDNLILYGD